MKRRLMIARALVHEPRLLILDEPTAGVDIEIRRSMWEFVKGINEAGTTIILTTHYLEEAENLCRNIAIIDEGRIIEHNRMDRLLRKLHKEIVLLNLAGPVEAAPELDGYLCRRVDEETLEVEITDQRGLSALFEQLNSRGIVVQSMRNKSNRLEELFMDLVENRAGRQQAAAEGKS
jgi:ABC-2 type transport system ATP-binding protein